MQKVSSFVNERSMGRYSPLASLATPAIAPASLATLYWENPSGVAGKIITGSMVVHYSAELITFYVKWLTEIFDFLITFASVQ